MFPVWWGRSLALGHRATKDLRWNPAPAEVNGSFAININVARISSPLILCFPFEMPVVLCCAAAERLPRSVPSVAASPWCAWVSVYSLCLLYVCKVPRDPLGQKELKRMRDLSLVNAATTVYIELKL